MCTYIYIYIYIYICIHTVIPPSPRGAEALGRGQHLAAEPTYYHYYEYHHDYHHYDDYM